MYYRPDNCYGSYGSLDNGELNKAYIKIMKSSLLCICFFSNYPHAIEDKALDVCCYRHYAPGGIDRHIIVPLCGYFSVVMFLTNHIVMSIFKHNYYWTTFSCYPSCLISCSMSIVFIVCIELLQVCINDRTYLC